MVPLRLSGIGGGRNSFKVLIYDSAVWFPSRITNCDFMLVTHCTPEHHRFTTEGSTTYVELAFCQILPVIHKSVKTIQVQLSFIYWISRFSTQNSSWCDFPPNQLNLQNDIQYIQGTALIFLYRRYSSGCSTCWTRLPLIFNCMNLFNFDALVI